MKSTQGPVSETSSTNPHPLKLKPIESASRNDVNEHHDQNQPHDIQINIQDDMKDYYDNKPSVSTPSNLTTKFFKQYIFGTAEGLRKWCCTHGKMYVIISCFFRGIGQVMFMDNPWTGLIMFGCLTYFHYYSSLLGLIAGFVNYGTAIILLGTEKLGSPSPNYLNNGIFVYNGVLVGLMCGTFVNGLNTESEDNGILLFLKLIPFCVIMSYICTSIHVGMTNMFSSFPVFTFPFNAAGYFYLPLSLQISWIHTTMVPYLAEDTFSAGMDVVSINNAYTMSDISYQVCVWVYPLIWS